MQSGWLSQESGHKANLNKMQIKKQFRKYHYLSNIVSIRYKIASIQMYCKFTKNQQSYYEDDTYATCFEIK